jgi:hypothetical protein
MNRKVFLLTVLPWILTAIFGTGFFWSYLTYQTGTAQLDLHKLEISLGIREKMADMQKEILKFQQLPKPTDEQRAARRSSYLP